jgi:hypothetical protein
MIINKNYTSEKISELLKTKITHNKIMNILVKSRLFKPALFELADILLKNKKFARKMINILT